MGLFDNPEDGLTDYGRPERVSSNQEDVYVPTAQDRAAQEYKSNLDYKKGVDQNARSATDAFNFHSKANADWNKRHVNKNYFNTFGVDPQGDDYDIHMRDLENHYSDPDNAENEDNANNFKNFQNLKRQYSQRKIRTAQFKAHADSKNSESARVAMLDSQVDPAKRAAYNNWKTLTGGKKSNGQDSMYMDPEKAHEVLDFINFKAPNWMDKKRALMPGGLDNIDPRFEFENITLGGKAKNDAQIERRKSLMRGEFESLWGDHEQASRIKRAGFNVPPSWMNEIGGSNRILGSEEERSEALIHAADKAGVDYFTNSDGQQIDVKEWIANSEYSEQEREAIAEIETLGEARTAYRDLQIDFWKLHSGKEKVEREEEWNKVMLGRQFMEEQVKKVNAMGFGRDLYGRAESISDVTAFNGWMKMGALQDDMADFSDNLIGGADNMSAKDFDQLSQLAEHMDFLGSNMRESGKSPLAELFAKSEEEKDTWLGAVGRWFSMDGAEALAELVVTNLRGFLPEYLDNAKTVLPTAAATGFVAGSFTGPGALASAGVATAWGAKANWGITSASMEYAATVLDLMKEEGVDVHNPRAFEAAWANEDMRNRIQNKAGKRAGIIAVADLVGAKMAGNVMAVAKSPSVLAKIPSARLSQRNLKGLSLDDTKKLTDLRKKYKKGKIQNDSPDFQEMQKLESKVQKRFGIERTESEFSKALAKADSQVNRLTWKRRLGASSAELGFGAATGGGGEAAAQLFTREPGEAWDKQSIIAEMMGEVGGLGAVGAVKETLSKVDLRRTPGVTISESALPQPDPNDPYSHRNPGTVEQMNNQGHQYERYYFESPDDATAFIARADGMSLEVLDRRDMANQPNAQGQVKEPKMIPNPEVGFIREYISGVHSMMANKGLKVKYVISERNPDGTTSGGYARQESPTDYVIYINPSALKKKGDTVRAALMHEMPHLLEKGIYTQNGVNRVLGWYNELDDEQRIQAQAHYMFKDKFPHTKAADLPQKEQAELKKEMDAINDENNPEARRMAASEWFSFEFVRVLAGAIHDKAKIEQVIGPDGQKLERLSGLPPGINSEILSFIDTYVYPMAKKYAGAGALSMASKNVSADPSSRGVGEAQMPDGTTLQAQASERPEKLAPENFYAQIIYDMGWGMNSRGDLIHTEDTPSKVNHVSDIESIFANQNQRLTDNDGEILTSILGPNSPFAGLKDRVDVKQGPEFEIRGNRLVQTQRGDPNQYDEEGRPYRVTEDPDSLISSDEIKNTLDTEIARQRNNRSQFPEDAVTSTAPIPFEEGQRVKKEASKYDEKDETGSSVTTEFQSNEKPPAPQRRTMDSATYDKAYQKALNLIDKESAKKLDTREKSIEDLTIQSQKVKKYFEKGALQNAGKYTLAKRLNTQLSNQIKSMEKKGVEVTDKVIPFQGEKISLEEAYAIRNEVAVVQQAYEKAAKSRVDLMNTEFNIGQNKEQTTVDGKERTTFKPAILKDKDGAPVVDTFSKPDQPETGDMLVQANIESQQRIVKEATGKTPEKIISDLEEVLEMSPKQLRQALMPIAEDLDKEFGRVSEEELFSRYLEKLGVTTLIDSNLEPAREAISVNSRLDPKSVEEAYEVNDQNIQSMVEILQKNIDDLTLEVSAQTEAKEKIRKGAEVPSLKEGAENLSVDQLGTLVQSLQNNLVKDFKVNNDHPEGKLPKDQLLDFLNERLTVANPDEQSKLTTLLAEFLQDDIVLADTESTKQIAKLSPNRLKWLTNDSIKGGNAETNAMLSAMEEKRKEIVGILNTGAIQGIKNEDTFKQLGKAESRIQEAKVKIDKRGRQKTALSIGSEAGNVDYRSAPAAFNFKPDKKEDGKGTDFSGLVDANTGKPVTLGQLAQEDSISVYYQNDKTQKKFSINGKEQLARLDKNFNWEVKSPLPAAEFESKFNMSYAEYRVRLLAALSSAREGETIQTKRGPQSTHFFTADSGVSPLAILLEKVSRIARDPSAEGLGVVSKLQSYESAFNEQTKKARKLRSENLNVQAKKELRADALKVLFPNGKQNLSASLASILRSSDFKVAKKTNILNEKNLPEEDMRFNKIYGEIDQYLKDNPNVLKKGKLKGPRIKVNDLLKALKVDTASMVKAQEEVVASPRAMLPRDLLNINYTAAEIAEKFYAEDTTTVGQIRYNRRVTDYLLSIEKNLVNDIAYLKAINLAGKGPKVELASGNQILKGDVFTYKNSLRKAKEDFEVNPTTMQKIEGLSNPIEQIQLSDKKNYIELSPEQKKEVRQRLQSAQKQLKRLNFISEFDYTIEPTVRDKFGALESLDITIDEISPTGQIGALFERGMSISRAIETEEYKQLQLIRMETIAAKGYNNSYLKEIAGKSIGNSHYEHTHVEGVKPKTEKQWIKSELPVLQKMGIRNLGLTLYEAESQLIKRVLEKQKKEDINKNFVEEDLEGLDAIFNINDFWLEALVKGSIKVKGFRGVYKRLRSGKKVFVDDIDKIYADPELREEYEKQNAELSKLLGANGLRIHYDNFTQRTDPVVRAAGLPPDVYDHVRNSFEREAALEAGSEGQPKVVKLNLTIVRKAFTQNGKSEKSEVIWDPKAKKFTSHIQNTSTQWSDRLDVLRAAVKTTPDTDKTVILRKGEKFYLNGFQYTVKNDITRNSREGEKIAEAFASEEQTDLIETVDQNLESVFEEATSLISKGKREAKQPTRTVTINDTFIDEQVGFHERFIEEAKKAKEKLMPDPKLAGPDILERVAEYDAMIKDHENQLKSLDAFKRHKDKDPKELNFKIFQGRNFRPARVKKVKKEWVVQVEQQGNFTYKNGNVLPDDVTDTLFTLTHDDLVGVNRGTTAQSMSSLVLTPRKLIQLIIDIGGLENIGLLAGGGSRFHRESAGGLPLLPYLDHLPDAMLDKLQGAGAIEKVIESLQEKIDNIKGSTKQDVANKEKIQSELNLYEAMKEEDINLTDLTMLQYVSNFRFRGAQNQPIISTKDGFSEKDLAHLKDITSKEKETSTFVAIGEKAKFAEGEILKIGMTQPKLDDAGNVTPGGQARPIYARVKIPESSLVETEEGQNPQQQAVTLDEFMPADDDGVRDSSYGNLEERWPKTKGKKGDSDTSHAAYVYELDIVLNEVDIRTAFYEAERDRFLGFDQDKKKRLKKVKSILEDLDDDPKAAAIERKRLAFENYANLEYLQKADKKLYDSIVEDMISGDEYLKAKLRVLARVVDDMGGIRITDTADVLAAEKEASNAKPDFGFEEEVTPDEVRSDPSDERNFGTPDEDTNPEDFTGDTVELMGGKNDSDRYFDPTNAPKNLDGGENRRRRRQRERGDPEDYNKKEKRKGAESEDDTFQDPFTPNGSSMNYNATQWERAANPGLLARMAKRMANSLDAWRNRAVDPNTPPSDLDLGQGGKGRIKSHIGAYGKFVEQFGPFLKAQPAILKSLGIKESDPAADKLRAYDKFYEAMGKAGDLLDEGSREYVNPISDAMQESKASQEDIGWYLYALIAPQANQAVRDNRRKHNIDGGKDLINDRGESRGSGITNSEAREIIQKLEKKPEMVKFIQHKFNPIKLMFDMHERSLKLMLDSEVISADQAGAMAGAAKPKTQENFHTIPVNFGNFRRLPLKGLLGVDDQYDLAAEEMDLLGGGGTAQGKGFDQPRGVVHVPALGREKASLVDVQSIFSHTARDFQQAVIRSSRAKAAQSINEVFIELETASNKYAADPKNNENLKTASELFKQFFEPAKTVLQRKAKMVEVNGEKAYQIDDIEVPAEIANSGRALFVREAGEAKLIMFADTEQGRVLASAAKNLTYEQLGTMLSFVNVGTKYMARVKTSWSPEFWATNPLRDITNAWFNLDAESEFKPIRNAVSNPLTFAGHASKIMSYERAIDKTGKAPAGYKSADDSNLITMAKSGDITAAYQLLKKHGGKTAFYKFESIPELLKKITKIASSKHGRKGGAIEGSLKAIVAIVDVLNTSMENVLRARVVMEGLKKGMRLERLIPAARDVTVDFNKRGTWSQNLGAVVQFANPNIQGNRRFAKSLEKRGQAASIKLGIRIATASLAYNTMMRLFAGREDDEEDDYSTYHDDISTRARHTSFVIPHFLLGDDDRKNPGYTRIPVGYGPHGFVALGDFFSKIGVTGGRHLAKDALEFSKSMYDTYAPVNPFTWEIPFVEAAGQLKNNRNWTGSPIYQEYYGSDVKSPEQLSKRSTPKIYKDMAKGINRLGGGNEEIAGSLRGIFSRDPLAFTGDSDYTLNGAWSGSGIEFFVKQYGGSLLDSVFNIANMFSGDPASNMEIPALKGIIRNRGSAYDSIGRYYDLRRRAVQAKASLNGMDPILKAEFLRKNKHYPKIIRLIESTDGQMNSYRRRRKALEAKKQEEGVIQQLDKLEDQRINIIRRVIGNAIDQGIDV